MVLLGDGHCQDGYYKGLTGLRDIQACKDLCLIEEECLYASFCAEWSGNDKRKCSVYNSDDCMLTTTQYSQSKLYTTYKKVKKGMNY